jgi:hypothetical protein
MCVCACVQERNWQTLFIFMSPYNKLLASAAQVCDQALLVSGDNENLIC